MSAQHPPDPNERTQRLPSTPRRPEPEQVYTEESGGERPASTYSEEYRHRPGERTMIDPGVQPPRTGPAPPTRPAGEPLDEEPGPRTWSTTALVFTGIITLLVGIVLALLLLPEEDSVALDDTASQQALTDAATQNEALAAENAALMAQNEQLEADLAARDAELQAAQAQQAGDQAAADQAAADREAALNEREAALNERETALNERETSVSAREEQVAAAEAGGGEDSPGIELPDIGDVELPQIDEEEARGVIERLVDRLQDLFGFE